MNRQIGAKQPLIMLIQQIIDHLDQAEVLEILGYHDRARWERAMAKEYRDMYRYRTEFEQADL